MRNLRTPGLAFTLALAACSGSSGTSGSGSGGAHPPSSSGGATQVVAGGTGGTELTGSGGASVVASTGGAQASTGGSTGGSSGTAGQGAGSPGSGEAGGKSGAPVDGGTVTGGGAGAGAGFSLDGGLPAGASPTEVDPGTDGDGEFHILPPYDNQPPGLTRMPGAPQGAVLGPMNFASTTIYPGRSFPIQIYVPAQYDKAKPAALMVTQDGRQWVGRFPIIYDNLIFQGKAPVTINLFIPASTPADRSDEYDTVSGKYGDFIMQEVLPWVKGMGYNITDDPAGRAATGNSSGGIAAFSIAWFKPQNFHRVLTSSATFRNIGGKGGDMYPTTVMSSPMSPLRVFLSSSEGDMPGWLDANRAMSNALMAKGNHVRFIWGDSSIPHGGGAMLNGDLPFAMEWLWRGYKPAQ